MLPTLDKSFYLLGSVFDQSKDADGNTIFTDWHMGGDLSSIDFLNKKVRPIPLTPVVLGALSASDKPQIWGTDRFGKLMYLGLGQPIKNSEGQPIEGELVETTEDNSGAPESDQTERILLNHSARVENIKSDTEYELSFPPVSWLAQMIGDPEAESGAAEAGDLAANLRDFVQQVDQSQTGVNFKLSKILPSQLAPAYVAEHGEALTEQQETYNQWRELKLKTPDKPIFGFMVPQMHTCAVMFTDPLYVGAEVTLVKPLLNIKSDSVGEASEEVIATALVAKPTYYFPDGTEDIGLPSAFFHLDPTKIDDGFYLIRVKFWKRLWEQTQDNPDAKLPDTVTLANITKTIECREGEKEPQDVYTYELYEKLTFKPSPGIGKVACVCGDMITLEETLIQQFPTQLPSYQDYATNGLTHLVKSTPGLGSLSLTGTILKTYDSITSDFVSMDGLKLNGPAGDIAKTIGLSLWENTEQGLIPDIVMSGLAVHAAIAARKDALKGVKIANILAKRQLNFSQTAALIFRKKVFDYPYLKRQFTIGRDASGSKSFQSAVGRLSKSWMSGTMVSRGLPIVATGSAAISSWEGYKGYRHAITNGEAAYNKLEEMSGHYLNHLTFIRKSNDKESWYSKAQDIQESLGEDARIYEDAQGIALHLNFQFNSSDLENEVRPLYSGFDNICNKLTMLLEANPSYQILIDGHAGLIGTEDNNLKVSKRRAEFVSEKLLANAEDKQAIEPRLITRYFGKSALLKGDASNYEDTTDQSDSADIAADRRVEVRLVVPDYKVVLPPSRSGSMKLEGYHQIWQSFMLEADTLKEELWMSTFDAIAGVALLTPAAPYAAYYFLAKETGQLMSSAADFYDDLFGQSTFEDLKQRYKTKTDLNTLGDINREVLKIYNELDHTIEKDVESDQEVDQHLNSKISQQELLKRFLLRAYALNSLVELLAIISSKQGLFTSYDELVEKYRVGQFIENYVMSDDWEAPVNVSNTLAQNWINRFHTQPSYYGLGSNYYYGLDWSNKVFGAFNSGFPVQTALYLDTVTNSLEQFCRDFDLNKQNLKKEDIGFTRLLVQESADSDANNGLVSGWCTYKDWLEKGGQRKIGPMTRVKVQVILTAKATESKKSVFTQAIDYRAEVTGFDIVGPSFDVLFTHKGKEGFIDPNNEIAEYFDSQGASQEDLLLSAVEFEPTFWFGANQINGVKPLCAATWLDEISAFVKGQSAFEYLNEANEFDAMRYIFRLDNIDLPLATWNKQGTETHEKRMHYGIQGKDYIVSESASQKKILNDRDFLIEEFVMSESTSKRDNTPQALKGDVTSILGIEIDGELRISEQWTSFDSINKFNWEKEQSFKIYVAMLGDETSHEEYDTMDLNADQCQMTLKLAEQGPVIHDYMYYSGKVTIKQTTRYEMGHSGYHEAVYDFELEHDSPLNNGLPDFARDALKYVEEKSGDYEGILKGKEEKHLYLMCFDFSYVSPTGKHVKGLRPYGDIVDGKDLKSFILSIDSLQQTALNEAYPLPDVSLRLPQAKQITGNKPWSETAPEQEVFNLSAARYWQKLDTEEKRAEWLEKWIKDKSTLLKAPEPELLQI
ncbi:OmpA family protein [Vibrio sp. Isolate23]|uniref:OmpA family protein n=1 Tax=Vibrio sp. Isolate23 TaxID=2908533 RepID=UPI001EFC8EC5|nr:OmpA family protein [Vibrio sp. Isolate23]MCG9681138.1 OmpA family protein [Vibrio sp. Isolate23]